jgi:hypothetical protein
MKVRFAGSGQLYYEEGEEGKLKEDKVCQGLYKNVAAACLLSRTGITLMSVAMYS